MVISAQNQIKQAPHLVILNYHGIETFSGEYPWDPAEKPYVLNISEFESQLELILANTFQTLDLSELNLWLDGNNFAPNQVLLTFDDGHISHHDHAMSALKKRNMKAIFLVSAGLAGQDHIMNWPHLKDLIARGFEIGSHGLKHQPLSNVTHHELWKELYKSKSILEDKLGVQITSFSVPRGYYQDRIREVALEVGYRFVFTSRFDVNLKGADRFRLNRIAVKKNMRLDHFLKLIHGHLGPKRTIEKFKETARRYIKPSIYDALAQFKRVVLEGQKESK